MEKTKKTIFNEPGFWFAKLERADAEGDSEDAAEATKNLSRLGWDVQRRPEKEEAVK